MLLPYPKGHAMCLISDKVQISHLLKGDMSLEGVAALWEE
jgi:hypothetical protein